MFIYFTKLVCIKGIIILNFNISINNSPLERNELMKIKGAYEWIKAAVASQVFLFCIVLENSFYSELLRNCLLTHSMTFIKCLLNSVVIDTQNNYCKYSREPRWTFSNSL